MKDSNTKILDEENKSDDKKDGNEEETEGDPPIEDVRTLEEKEIAELKEKWKKFEEESKEFDKKYWQRVINRACQASLEEHR